LVSLLIFANLYLSFRGCVAVRSPCKRAFQLSNLRIGSDAQAPPLAFVPQFQQGVLAAAAERRDCMANVLGKSNIQSDGGASF